MEQHRQATRRLNDLAISDSGFVFDPCSGSTFTVNASGKTILEGLKQGCGRDELVALLEQRFTPDGRFDLHRDIDEFVHLLRMSELVDAEFTVR